MATSSGATGEILLLGLVERSSGGVEARVRVASPEWMRTTTFPGIAEETLSLLPGLARHRCESDSPRGMVAELADTETPHLVEHIALELLALAGWSRETRGRTHWDFGRDGNGVYRVWLACPDPEPASGALEGAIAVVVWLLGRQGRRPDVDAIASQIEPPGP